jgi:hypothetical protein
MKDDQVVVTQQVSLPAQNIGHVGEVRLGGPGQAVAGKAC